jgi:DNA-binding beta-propeller fold protein YncE
MQIVGEYDTSVVHGNGCLGAEVPGKMYIDSGGGTANNLHRADLYAFPTDGYSALNPANVPLPKLVFSDPSHGADAHGAALTLHGRYLWVADRGRNFLWVVDTSLDQIVNIIPLEGNVSDDPTPDLVAVSPNGSHAFLSLRGPVPLTADPHVSTGSTPGVGILKINEGGRNAIFEAVAPVSNIDPHGVERADVHAMTIRRLARPR